MFRKYIKLVPLVLAVVVGTAHAFEINPNHDPAALKRSLKSEYQRFLARLTSPTHEQLTQSSLECAEAKISVPWCELSPADLSLADKFDPEALTFGVRWNDDPNNFFRVHQEVTWLLWLKAASIHPSSITPIYPLEYRSHYGDLQFLHGMGRGADDAARIQLEVLDWAHFAYDVATGRIAPATRMSALEDTYPFARNFARTSKRNWTARKLFTNVGDVICPTCRSFDAKDEEVPGLALGALLHTIQDSFSHSHVERSAAGVNAWLDYAQQDPDCHGNADKDTAWIRDDSVSAKPAITWGAWVIRSAMLKAKWEDGLADRLANELFVLDQPKTPYHGGFIKGGAACKSAKDAA